MRAIKFWSSADLTGNQTSSAHRINGVTFWSSADLTGNQTGCTYSIVEPLFWSSADLTGNQTVLNMNSNAHGFGAVPI